MKGKFTGFSARVSGMLRNINIKKYLRGLMVGGIAVTMSCGLLAGDHAVLANPFSTDGKTPVTFNADLISHDNDAQTVTASGNVEVVQGEQIIRADKLVYKLETEVVSAVGNVSILDNEGNVYFAEYAELSKDMRDGFVHGLISTLSDGSRFTAVEAQRIDGNITKMKEATYTPCKICPGKKPLWQLVAKEVEHNDAENTVKYKNARIEIAGIPIVYTPLFSHPDPDQERKSGFLRPDGGWSSERGAFVSGSYYHTISPDKDMTVTLQPSTNAGVLMMGEWRQRFEKGNLQVEGGLVNSDRVTSGGRIKEDEWRGHIFADGRYDINDKWRAGFEAEKVTDKEYLRLYDISSRNVLESRVYGERFSGRNYTNISAYGFQDVRLGARPEQPGILPTFEHSMLGEPGGLLGGRWSLDLGGLGLHRNDGGQDVYRGMADAGWERRFASSLGLVTTIDTSAQGAVYKVLNSAAAAANPALDDNPTSTRFFPQASVTTKYPLARPFERGGQLVIEPTVGLTAAPNISQDVNDIPNEDSIDVQLDSSNLFSDSRFPGIDRVDDGIRATYGSSLGYFADNGSYGRIFLGQSYRFTDDNPYQRGSGLEDDYSDLVGKLDISAGGAIDVTYRFQLDDSNFKPRRHEVAAAGDITDKLRMNTNYIYAGAVAGTGFTETREQIRVGGIYRFNENWNVQASALTDLGEQPGLRRANAGLNFVNECLDFGLIGSKNITNRASGESDTTVLMRLGLKNLGNISTPEILLRSEDPNAP